MSSVHASYLRTLYLLLCKIRREGLMAIEEDVEVPEQSRIFLSSPDLHDRPIHFEFLRDTLRLMVGGLLDPADLTLYADTAEKAFLLTEAPDVVLWNALRTTIIAAVRGCAPQVAVEFGRQALPYDTRPSFDELEQLLKNAHYAWREETDTAVPPLRERVAAWFARFDERKDAHP